MVNCKGIQKRNQRGPQLTSLQRCKIWRSIFLIQLSLHEPLLTRSFHLAIVNMIIWHRYKLSRKGMRCMSRGMIWLVKIFEASFQFPSPSQQQQQSCEQHSKQPKHARAVQSCVNAIAHWSFILEQHWMQHIQQHLLNIRPQQFEAALMSSAASDNFVSTP